MRLAFLACIAAVSGIVPAALSAQPNVGAVARSDRRGERGIEAWAGLAFHSPDWGVLGRARNMNLALSALRWSRRVGQTSNVSLEYTADVVPAAVLWPVVRPAPASSPGCQYCLNSGGLRPAHGVFGAGVSPLGLTVVARPASRLQFALGVTGGALWFAREVPSANATRFNFTATAEAGVTALTPGGTGLVFTYRLHHLSNAGLAGENLGIASRLLSVGVRWRLGRDI